VTIASGSTAEACPMCETNLVRETERIQKASAAEGLSGLFTLLGPTRTNHGAIAYRSLPLRQGHDHPQGEYPDGVFAHDHGWTGLSPPRPSDRD
jgi:hypothetical protein